MSDNNETQDRNPAPDQAEDNAFFPSPYSLTQYTSNKTDFDGLATEEKYTGGRWKILTIATDERYMRMKNGKFFSTGNHPVETLLPIHHMHEAGYEIEVATVSGGAGKFEWWAFPKDDGAIASAWQATREKFKSPLKLADVIENNLDDYAAIFIPGGHGAMNVIPFSKDVQDSLDYFLNNDRLIISLCHGPAAFLAANIGRTTNPFAGYKITAFPDALDFGANLEIGYIPGEMPWALGGTLKKEGIEIINDDMTGATTRDRNLLTGDSPLAANQLGKDSVLALLEQFGN